MISSSHIFVNLIYKIRHQGQHSVPYSLRCSSTLVTHVMLFWCSVSRAVLRSSVVARLSMFLKRSMAEMFLWMLCLGRSSFDTNVSVPPSSQRNSMGQQSWPWRCRQCIQAFGIDKGVESATMRMFDSYRGYETVLWNKNDTEERKKLRLQLWRTEHTNDDC